jgi:hypothetical protein
MAKIVSKNKKNTNKKSSRFRKISKDKYVITFVITFLIFSLGLTLGMVFEENRYNWAESINQEQDLQYLSLQLQYLFLNTFESEQSCPVLLTTLQESVNDLTGSLQKILDFEKENSINEEEYEQLERRYTLDNIRYWLLANEAKESCDLDIVSILYFYSDECQSCPGQGTILTYFKKLFGEDVLVFPINVDMNEIEPTAKIVTSLHNVTELPTLIIGGERYNGIVKKNQLQEIICSILEHKEECQGDENLQ